MNYDEYDRIRRLQSKQRELEEELEKNDFIEDEIFVIAEIERIQKEVDKLSEGRYF